MMWYPTPFNKEFFAYFDQERALVGWEPLKFSWGKASIGMVLAQDTFYKRGWIWRFLPFVELVALTGETSFNTDSISSVGLRIVSSTKRMWSVHAMIKTVLLLINLWQRRKWWLEFVLETLQEPEDLNVISFKDAEYDIIPLYQVAHLSLWYQKFSSTHWNIFESNRWIQEYLPHHPLQFVIGCGQELVQWKAQFGLVTEKLFSNFIWDLLNYISKQVSLVYLMLLKKLGKTTARMQDGVIWHDIRNKEQYLLRWKVLRKENM